MLTILARLNSCLLLRLLLLLRLHLLLSALLCDARLLHRSTSRSLRLPSLLDCPGVRSKMVANRGHDLLTRIPDLILDIHGLLTALRRCFEQSPETMHTILVVGLLFRSEHVKTVDLLGSDQRHVVLMAVVLRHAWSMVSCECRAELCTCGMRNSH